jgi:L-amino acid N-acyltransferase YncA
LPRRRAGVFSRTFSRTTGWAWSRRKIDTRNVASIALVESLGFERVAFHKDADHFKGSSSGEYRYEIEESVWAGKRPRC